MSPPSTKRTILLWSILFLAFAAIRVQAKRNDDLVSEFTTKTGASLFSKEHQTFCLLLESKVSDDYDDFYEEFLEAAQKFENKVKFVYINTDVEENWKVIEYLGLIAEDIPAILFINLEEGLVKYKADFDEITRKNIIKFAKDCLNGKTEAFVKGDEVPKDWDEKPLKELVSETFNKFVYNKQYTTFVIFYAPWCQACANVMPEIEKLAKSYENSDKVMIAKMNAINNEVLKMPVIDVPTIALFIDGNRKPVYYKDDERTASDFAKFIEKHIEKGEKKADDDKNQKQTKSKKAKKTEL